MISPFHSLQKFEKLEPTIHAKKVRIHTDQDHAEKAKQMFPPLPCVAL